MFHLLDVLIVNNFSVYCLILAVVLRNIPPAFFGTIYDLDNGKSFINCLRRSALFLLLFYFCVSILPFDWWMNTFRFLRCLVSTKFWKILFLCSGALSKAWKNLEQASRTIVITLDGPLSIGFVLILSFELKHTPGVFVFPSLFLHDLLVPYRLKMFLCLLHLALSFWDLCRYERS